MTSARKVSCSELGAGVPLRIFKVAPRRVCSSAMERSQPATTNSVSLISYGTVSEQIYLTQYGRMAERHWRKFLPTMVLKLEANGTLMETLFDAQEMTLDEMETLTRQLETEQKLTPQQAHEHAR